MLRPSVDNDDAMKMIGHDCEGIQFHTSEVAGDLEPAVSGMTPGTTEPHQSVAYFTEQGVPRCAQIVTKYAPGLV